MSEPDIIYNFFQQNRSHFPYLEKDSSGQKRIYLNSGAGSLMVDSCYQAIEMALRNLNSMPGMVSNEEIQTAELHQEARKAVADFIGANSPEEISFHFSTTAALFNLAFALRKLFQPGKNCLVTDLDHLANISPWETIAQQQGAEIRRIHLNDESQILIDKLIEKVDRQTVLVALTGASNVIGIINPLTDLIQEIKQKSDALVVIDAVHLAPHSPIDVREIGGDFLTFSGYKLFGPMIGILYARKESQPLSFPYRVETNRPQAPFCWEQGMLPNLAISGLKGALDYLEDLGNKLISPRDKATTLSRTRVFRLAMEGVKNYEQKLSLYFMKNLERIDRQKIKFYGLVAGNKIVSKVPTFAFEIFDYSAAETKRLFWEKGKILIADGNHYSAFVTRHLKKEALNRLSLAHYDNLEAIDRFFDTLENLIYKK
ncbi:MAG: aminotransferase class V-fold PLP-dependent enzyme [Candidatus Saccharicenans sp.]